MASKKYKLKNTNLLHDSIVYKIGDVIELDEKQAKKTIRYINPRWSCRK